MANHASAKSVLCRRLSPRSLGKRQHAEHERKSAAGVDRTPPSLVADNQAQLISKASDAASRQREAASSANTREAYALEWKYFAAWYQRSNLNPIPPSPNCICNQTKQYIVGGVR
ncbi:hypothetical protein AJ87_08730 [Rhizobium yanglingense]|nr:hypothetical protein AJ87_08730 [Rhizobium yanglingense]